MKTIILFFLFSIAIVAQSNGYLYGDGAIWSDSLKTGTDTSYVVSFKYNYSYVSIAVKDTGSSIIDSLKAYKGHARLNSNGSVVDTIWDTNPLPLKNNIWAEDTLMAGGGKTKSYMILDNNIDLLEIRKINKTYTSGVKTDIIIEATKK